MRKLVKCKILYFFVPRRPAPHHQARCWWRRRRRNVCPVQWRQFMEEEHLMPQLWYNVAFSLGVLLQEWRQGRKHTSACQCWRGGHWWRQTSPCVTEIKRGDEQELPAAGQQEYGLPNCQPKPTEEYQEVQQTNHHALQCRRDQYQHQRQTGGDDNTSHPPQHSKCALPQVDDTET